MRAFRIVVAGHGGIAAAFIASAEMICGPIEDAVAVALLPEQSPEQLADAMREAVGPEDVPVLLLTDLAGGTPSNVACLVARGRANTVTLAGLNLGILVEAATGVTALDDASIRQLVEAGRTSIVDLTKRMAASGS